MIVYHTYTYTYVYIFVVIVQSLSCVQLFVTAWTATHQASLSFTISWSLLKFMSIRSVIVSNHLILCHSLLLPSIFSSITFPMSWLFTSSFLSIGPSASTSVKGLMNGYSGLIYFRIDWFDLLAIQGTSRVFSSTTIQKHQFLGSEPFLSSDCHICT